MIFCSLWINKSNFLKYLIFVHQQVIFTEYSVVSIYSGILFTSAFTGNFGGLKE